MGIRPRYLPLLLLAFFALAGLAGCGKSGGDSPADPSGNSSLPRRHANAPAQTPDGVSLDGAHVTRGDVSTESAGIASSAYANHGYVSHRTSVGGSYLQLRGVASPNYRVSAGLYGHPQATK